MITLSGSGMDDKHTAHVLSGYWSGTAARALTRCCRAFSSILIFLPLRFFGSVRSLLRHRFCCTALRLRSAGSCSRQNKFISSSYFRRALSYTSTKFPAYQAHRGWKHRVHCACWHFLTGPFAIPQTSQISPVFDFVLGAYFGTRIKEVAVASHKLRFGCQIAQKECAHVPLLVRFSAPSEIEQN